MRAVRAVRAGLAVCTATLGLVAVSASHASAAGPLQVTSNPALYPSFSTAIHYYVSVCNNQPLQLTVTVPSGTTVVVDGQPPQSGKTYNTQVSLNEGQEFIINWTGDPQPYHVRCLPSDFPQWTSQTLGTPQTAYLVTTPSIGLQGGFSNLQAPYVAVFDTNGVPRWWWKESDGNGLTPIDAKVLANGDLVWMDFSTSVTNTPYEEHQLGGALVRTYNPSPSNAATDLHELQVLPNGNYFLAIDTQANVDVSACEQPHVTDMEQVSDQVIEELDPSGNLLWSWDTAAHIGTGQTEAGFYPACTGTPRDPFHFNAIQPDCDGNIIVSFRHLGALYKIRVDPGQSDDGDILWKLGGTSISQSLTISGDPGTSDFGGQHDVRLYTDGTLTLHDNGTTLNRPARALRFSINTTTHTATLVETDSDNINSGCCGSARKLSGGNWLIDWGGTPTITEMTPGTATSSGAVVFSLTFNSVFSYRAVPITDASYGDTMTAGMNAQYPRAAQDGGPPSTIPEAPVASMMPIAGIGGALAATVALRRRTRQN